MHDEEMTPKCGLVVVADDNVEILKTVAVALSEAFEVIALTSSTQAVRAVREKPEVRVVILDVRFDDDIDGLEALQMIHQSHPELPVIIMTATHDSAEMRDAACGLGAFAFHSKPLNLSELVDDVTRAVGTK